MDLYEGLLTRRSVRQFDSSKEISQSDLLDIIKAAQYAPSAHNKQPWEFLVIKDKMVMSEFKNIQPWTSFAKDASAVILVCGNTDEAFSRNKEDIRN
jgi:nitroreductase